ncbi:alpha/beta hydrolase family protein [Pedomonas mirosovicensis]|uniref:alpha/beta hydrolase family protein n=1 Tax=Pedomonas mirosovicensis TaxID=2908641 RepID=UPI0021681BA7|nr:S9 family peptidase [Pedomonas mirosovicensis]MCH8684268.1 S9 family peptidase [Pedomonas mirosovicensis]
MMLLGSVPPQAAVAANANSAQPALIPTEDFAQLPVISAPELSPSGTMLLGMVRRGSEEPKETLGVIDLFGDQHQFFPVSDGYEVAWYRWAGNGKVLISLGRNQKFRGNDIYVTRLVAFDLATRETKFVGKRTQGIVGDDVLYVDPDGKWLLLSIQKTLEDYPAVYRVDLETDDMELVVGQRAGVWQWFADSAGVVRGGYSFTQQGYSLFYRSRDGDPLRRIDKVRYDGPASIIDGFVPVPDSDEGYVLSSEQTGRRAVYRFDFATLTLGERLFESPTNDISNISLAPDKKSLLAAYYTDERHRVEWFDPALKELQAALDKSVAPQRASIVSRSRDNTRLLVHVSSPDNPGNYYLFQMATATMNRVAAVNEKLRGKTLASPKPISYKARDGLEIHGYLTLPPGREAKGLPLIIMPHGGPYGVRDNDAYDPDVQFLANRGYAVLQPNYRGSGGYGWAFEERGDGQWGRAMQDDLDDGMDWLVKEGIADPKRVCIVGASYGGYAALWGATRNPERYRCAASFAGVTDIARQLRYSRDFFYSGTEARVWKERVRGDKDADIDDFSPLRQIDRLQVPVFLAHGDDDQRVPPEQSILYARALEKAGKPHEFYLYKDEGHGFSHMSNRKAYFNQLEAFLRKHNPPD